VNVIISGRRVSPEVMLLQEKRYAVLDGRIDSDLDKEYGPEIMPWLSANWRGTFGLVFVSFFLFLSFSPFLLELFDLGPFS